MQVLIIELIDAFEFNPPASEPYKFNGPIMSPMVDGAMHMPLEVSVAPGS